MTSMTTSFPKQAERLLQRSAVGICEIDSAGRCLYLNPAGAQLLGYEARQLVGAVLHNVIHPSGQSNSPVPCSICQTLEAAPTLLVGEPQRFARDLFLHKEGHTISMSYANRQIVTAGIPPGVVMTFYDDQQFVQLQNELRDRTAELATSESRKIEFIATLAHELRNPLAPIRTALELMRKAGDDTGSTKLVREVMERQLAQMIRLINDLLEISRLTTCQVTLRKERVDLGNIIRLALEASEPQIANNMNTLTLTSPLESIYVQADAIRLAQVFTNLLNNAAQYSKAGGPISVAVKSDRTSVEIDIADAGVGIPGEALNSIFEMFTRVGRNEYGIHGGLGIGLHLARRLVEMHDGRLIALSEGPGKGSHFLVTLPVAESIDEEQMSDDRQTSAAAPRAARVLLVDDNVDAAVSLSLLLQLGGHTTQVAHSGSQALERVAEFKPDVVLLDLGLPGMSGYEVARAIRATPQIRQPVLVALTGWGAPEDRLKSKQAGLDEHLTKPVDISMIEHMLSALPIRD
jgi:PAS domain S-box-containing protein